MTTNLTNKKNMKVTFTVEALVSPEEYARVMGYPAGSLENEMNFESWGDEEFGECICTYGYWNRFFRITDRKVVNIEETEELFNDPEESNPGTKSLPVDLLELLNDDEEEV